MIELNKIIKKSEANESYVNIEYVNKNKDVVSTHIHIFSEKKNHPDAEWDFIKERTLEAFAKNTADFLCFFPLDAEKIDVTTLSAEDLPLLHDKVCVRFSEIYKLPEIQK